MNVLVLQSSGRVNGNSAHVAQCAMEALTAEALRAGVALGVETINLARVTLNPCAGCRSCFDRGEDSCPHKDDLLEIKNKMAVADCLVLASPVYINDVNGIMKTWMDRLAHVCHRPQFAGKAALLLATTGSTSGKHTLRSMQVPLWTWGYRVSASACFSTGASSSLDDIRRRHGVRIGAAARRLFRDVHEQRPLKPSFVSLLVFRIQQAGWGKTSPGSLDHAFWRDRGWLDLRRCTFFFPHRASPITTRAARIIGAVAAMFVT